MAGLPSCLGGGRTTANITLHIVNKTTRLGPVPTPEPSLTPGPAQRILFALGRPGGARSVTELSAALGVHANTVRTALTELRTAGLVQRDRAPASGRGRPSYAYSLTQAGRNAQPSGRAFREYRSLTEAFASHLASRSEDPSQDARSIGRTWGASLAANHPGPPAGREGPDRSTAEGEGGAPADARASADADADADADAAMVDLLTELGFGPDLDGDGIALRTCPLLELAEEMPEVICQVHRGLVEGAMDHYGTPSDGVELLPFAEVGACRLHLHQSAATSNRAAATTARSAATRAGATRSTTQTTREP